MLEQAPQRFGMPAHSAVRVDDEDRIVEHLQGAFCFGGEVDVSGRVDQRQLRIPEFDHRLLGVDRDAAALLELVEVEMRITRIHAAKLPHRPGAEQQRLDERRLARVDVGKHPYDSPFDNVLLVVCRWAGLTFSRSWPSESSAG